MASSSGARCFFLCDFCIITTITLRIYGDGGGATQHSGKEYV